MKTQKLFIVILCLVLCFSLFSACSNTDDSSASSGDANATSSNDAGTEYKTITVNSFLPEATPLTQGTIASVANIAKYTDGEIVANGYYSGTLLDFNDSWEGTISGSADISYIGPALMDAYSTLTQLFSIPIAGMPTDGAIPLCDLYWELVNERPEFDDEFAGSNLKIIWTEALSGSGLHSSVRLVKQPSDAVGLTVEGLGLAGNKYWANCGANTVSLALADYYSSLERGIVDSFYNSIGNLAGMKTLPLLPYHTIFGVEDGAPSGCGLSCGTMLYVCNLDTWKSFTTEQQSEITQAFKDGSQQVALSLEREEMLKALDEAHSAGHEFYYINGEEAEPWYAAAQPIVDEWITDCDEKGYDGAAIWETWECILTDYQAGLSK